MLACLMHQLGEKPHQRPPCHGGSDRDASAGRVPAGMNGCVGIKATIGYVSTAGVVPAARSLDCLTCLARSVEDAALVMRTMRVSPCADPKGVGACHVGQPPQCGQHALSRAKGRVVRTAITWGGSGHAHHARKPLC